MFDSFIRVTPRTHYFRKRYTYKTDVIPREVGQAIIIFEIEISLISRLTFYKIIVKEDSSNHKPDKRNKVYRYISTKF